MVEAAGPKPAAWTSGNHGRALDDDALFVIGNTLFTVYHELGHALIDMLNLPVIGREEDAVDGFAAVTMIPDTPDALRDALIVAVADGWHAQSLLTGDDGEKPYWDEHALDEQRYFAIVCLMVGSDQNGFFDFALEAGVPEERIETCAYDFERMKNGWKRLLAPYRSGAGGSAQPVQPFIDLRFDAPKPDQRGVYDLIREDGTLERAVLKIADHIELPMPVTIRFAACDDANAYWSPDQREVTICYELIDDFEAMLLEANAG
ncbi:MAG: DUF4344 domain-containing metallopeptidase [Geminicoccaceae bacterium]